MDAIKDAEWSAPLRFRTLWLMLRHELLYVSWAMMEVALITPLALALMPWARYWSPALVAAWLTVLMFIPFNLSRIMSVFEITVDRQRIVMVIGLLTAVLISLRNLLYDSGAVTDLGWLIRFADHVGLSGNPYWTRDAAIFLLVAFMWWRGLSLSGRHVDIGEVGLRLRASALIAAPLVAGFAASQLSWSVAPFVLLFILFGLASVVLTRVEHLELSRSGQSFPLGLWWIVFVFVAAAAVVFAAGVVAGFASGDSIDDVVGWLSPVWTAANFIAATVVAVISYMSLPVLLALSWLASLLIRALGPSLQNVADNLQLNFEPPFPAETMEEADELVGSVSLLPRQLLAILVMVFFVLLVSLALNRLVGLMRRPAPAEGEFVNPLDDLAPFGAPGLGQRLLKRFGLFRRWRAAASVRRVYREMSETAAAHGYPRAESETPLEYLPTLALAWPDHTSLSSLITEAYNRVRYGEIPETEQDLKPILLAWRELEKILPASDHTAPAEVEVRARR